MIISGSGQKKACESRSRVNTHAALIAGVPAHCRWEDLILHPMRHLDNTLVLLTYRTLDRTPPDMSPLTDVRFIEARSFSKATLQSLVLK